MTPETLTVEYLRTPPSVVVLLWVLLILALLSIGSHLWRMPAVARIDVWTRSQWIRRAALRVVLCAWIGWTLWGAR